MPSEVNRAAFPTAIRLTEVENAVLNVLDERGIREGKSIYLGEIDVAMDARGYAGRWVVHAVESLVKKGLLRRSGPSYLTRTGQTSTIRSTRTRTPHRRARRPVPI